MINISITHRKLYGCKEVCNILIEANNKIIPLCENCAKSLLNCLEKANAENIF